jgi:hypothetical protein
VLTASVIRVQAFIITLMMGAASTSEMPVNFYQTTRRYNPGDSHLQVNLTFYVIALLFSAFSLIACCVSRPSRPPWLDLPNNIWWRLRGMQLLSVQSYEYVISFWYFTLNYLLASHEVTKNAVHLELVFCYSKDLRFTKHGHLLFKRHVNGRVLCPLFHLTSSPPNCVASMRMLNWKAYRIEVNSRVRF